MSRYTIIPFTTLTRTLAFAGLVLVLAIAECWSVQPYQPTHPDPVLESWRWQSFPELKGLGLRCMAEDRDGNMWFGTDEGVRRYDGVRWTVYTPEDGVLGAPVTTLCATQDGSVYAGTEIGISRFKDGAWSRVFPPEGEFPLPIRDLMEASDGSVWAGTAWGALRLGKEGAMLYTMVEREAALRMILPDVQLSFVPDAVFLPFSVFDVFEDREGAMWFGLWSGEIVRYDPSAAGDATAWQLYTEEDELDSGGRPRIFQTRDGTIWTVSWDARHGVNRFDGKAWTHFRLSDLGGGNANPSILETQDGTLWVGGKGINLHAYRNGVWTVYRTPGVPIPIGRVIGLLEASDGALWVAGRGQEAVRLDYKTSRWTTYEGLNLQCETPDGAQWFLSQDKGVVRYDPSASSAQDRRAWTRYGVEDGLMDSPYALLASRDGGVWAAGSHEGTAATARFDGRRWSLQTHPRLSRVIFPNAVYESLDGALWFGAGGIRERGQLGGVLRFEGRTWEHYTPPEAPNGAYGIGQTADGVLWLGGSGLRRFDGETWTTVTEPEELGPGKSIDVLHNTPQGDLWVGSRNYGVLYYDGKAWTRYDVRDGLTDNRILSILRTDDGSVWVGTNKGFSRFDGRTWTTYALPSDLRGTNIAGGQLRQSRDGALWINSSFGSWFWHDAPGSVYPKTTPGLQTVRYEPDTDPPETEITVSVDRVSQPGNTVFAWKGADPWRDTPEEEIQYSYRLDGGDWSPFSLDRYRIFLSLPAGSHTFEVRARDRDFNVDPTPAAFSFTVVPWK